MNNQNIDKNRFTYSVNRFYFLKMSASDGNRYLIAFKINPAENLNHFIKQTVKLFENTVIVMVIICLYDCEAVKQLAVIASHCFDFHCVALEIKSCVCCNIIFAEAVCNIRQVKPFIFLKAALVADCVCVEINGAEGVGVGLAAFSLADYKTVADKV